MNNKQIITLRNSDFETALIQIEVDWSHPKAKKAILDMSCYWSGHPEKSAPIEEHVEYFMVILANHINGNDYLREMMPKYIPDEINEILINGNLDGSFLRFDTDGYLPLDGRYGIVLKAVVPVDFNNWELE